MRAFSRHGAALGADGMEVDQIRPFGEVSDEPEQSQQHDEDDEQKQALPRSGLWLRAIDPVKFHRRVPQPFQPLHQVSHLRLSSAGAGLANRAKISWVIVIFSEAGEVLCPPQLGFARN
jgi:hypothetical protein